MKSVLLTLALLPMLAMAADPFRTAAEVAPLAPCQTATEERPLTLADAVSSALCANPQTREVWANALVQAAAVGSAEAAWLPSLSATATVAQNRASGARTDQTGLGTSLSWLALDFGGRDAAIESARQLLAASTATRDATVQGVLLAAVQAWYQVHGQLATLAAAQESEKAAERSYRAADARYKAGTATPADQLQARTAWSQAQLTRIQAEGALRTAEGALAVALGREARQKISIAPLPQITPPIDSSRTWTS